MTTPASALPLSGLTLRPARPEDPPAILAMVTSERLNPIGLHGSRFQLALTQGRLIGAVQMCLHRDGSRELGSLVVIESGRGLGVAVRLIDAVLAERSGPVQVITNLRHAGRWARWGLAQIATQEAPRSVCFNYWMGRLARVLSFLRGQPARHRVILMRPAVVKTNVCRIRDGAMQAGLPGRPCRATTCGATDALNP